jgi:hypothetical protein
MRGRMLPVEYQPRNSAAIHRQQLLAKKPGTADFFREIADSPDFTDIVDAVFARWQIAGHRFSPNTTFGEVTSVAKVQKSWCPTVASEGCQIKTCSGFVDNGCRFSNVVIS